jgi:hypothetical protein
MTYIFPLHHLHKVIVDAPHCALVLLKVVDDQRYSRIFGAVQISAVESLEELTDKVEWLKVLIW